MFHGIFRNESEMKKIRKLDESAIVEMVAEKLNEAFKSGKLAQFAKQHGGLKYGDWSASFGNDLHNMSDEDFEDYQILNPEDHYRQHGWQQQYGPKVSGLNNDNFKPLNFNDGTFMAKKTPDMSRDDRERAYNRKRDERRNNKRDDGKDTYHSVDPERDKILNPQDNGLGLKPRGRWGFPGEGDLAKNQLNKRALKANGWNPETTNINRDRVSDVVDKVTEELLTDMEKNKDKKNTVKLTVGNDEMDKMVKEAFERASASNNAVNQLQQAYELVTAVTKSGFIPFTSPAPSTTEQEVKNAILNAQNYLMMAINKARALYN